MIEYMKRFRIGADGKATFAIVQAEDELAAIGMVLGAGWAGARAMTATAGPGISLMAEFAGLAYYAEIPGVIWDIQRVGPSTGLPTRTSQGDILSTAFLSHGDTKHIMLLPCSAEECFTMAGDAFDLAEQFQTLVFVMSDLDLGMNNWMADPFKYPEKPISRGKVLSKEDLDRLGGFARYKDVDGDGIGYRTLPGTDHPAAAYFTRGSGHNEKAQYSERPDDFERNMERLNRKFETARSFVPRPEVDTGKSKIGIIAYGTSHWGLIESRDQLREEYSIETDYLRLRAYPFTREVHDFVKQHDRVYVVEQNRDAQMLSLLKLDLEPTLVHAPAQHRSHSRAAARRALRNRRTHVHGGQVNGDHARQASSAAQNQSHRLDRARLSRRQDHPVRGLRPQCDFRAHHRCHVRNGRAARARNQAQRHWLFVEEPGVLHEPLAQLQRGARTHAVGGDRRGAGQSSSDGARRERRRRHRFHRHRPVRPPDAAQSADHLHHRRQRRLRPDQGPVLRHRRSGLKAEDRRHQRPAADRYLRHGDHAGSDLRGPVVLRRQEAACTPC